MNHIERKHRFSGQFLSIPNVLSYVRLALIPLIMILYLKEEYYFSAGLMALSAATDVVDGWIARHFQMITDWGKIIDPIADKLTQIAIAVCLALRYHSVRYMLALLVIKEVYMCIIGMVFIHKTDTVEGSVWYGKTSTVVFLITVLVLVLLPKGLPQDQLIAWVLVGLESALLLLSMILYTIRYRTLYKKIKTSNE